MMISAATGFINQSEKYSRDNAGQSLKKYTLLKKGELAYNHGASKLREFGCCFELFEPEARVPYVYHSFGICRENNSYIALLLNNPLIDRQLKRLVSSSVRMDGLLNISYDEYMSVQLHIPNAIEQEHIVEFLFKLDKRIEKQQELVDSLKLYKRGALSKFFDRSLRFDKEANWDIKRIDEIFAERCERSSGHEQLLAVTINYGIQIRDEIDKKDNSSEDKSNYKKVFVGDIAYNTMRMWQGASGYSSFNGIVSPAYTVIFPINKEGQNIVFWSYYFKDRELIKTFQKFSQGLTSDTWNLKFNQMASIKVFVPPYEEQCQIAKFLTSIERKITHEETRLEHMQKMKRGLLNNMFV